MPELPDVEAFKRYIDSTALHHPIRRVTVPAPRVLGELSRRKLADAVSGHAFTGSYRWGKHLFLALDNGQWLALHFGMTSHPRYSRDDNAHESPDAAFDAVRFFFDNGYVLAFNSRRKLGHIHLIDDPQRFGRRRKLGPDVLELEEGDFVTIAQKARGSLKSFLMNQKHLSGLGNETSDEVLFQARRHPQTQVRSLNVAQYRKLFHVMHKVLKADLDANAEQDRMPDWFLLPRRREGAPCPRCRGPIRKIRVSGRSAYICPECQPEP